MKKIEIAMLNAIESGRNFSQGNTQVATKGDTTCVYLHGHLIATYDRKTKTYEFSDAGRRREGETCGTNTTKSRLNAMGAGITRKSGKWYQNGCEWVNDFDIEGTRNVDWRHTA
jgi:hypothetical protein